MRLLTVLVLALFAAISADRVAAQEYLGTYTAYIGQQDLYNSNGLRLRDPGQILRQERANFHRYGISQAGDAWDAWFGDMANRATLERSIQQGGLAPAERNLVLQGDAWVQMDVFGWGNRVAYVRATVYR